METGIKPKAFHPEVFRAYDIRGLYPEELDHNTIGLIAAGFVEYLRSHQKGNFCLLGEDVRYTSPEIRELVQEALLAGGMDVLEIGMVNIPLFIFALFQSQADGGIMVTSSHNSIRSNGLKLYEETSALSERTAFREIKNIIKRDLDPFPGPKGRLRKKDFNAEYVEFLVSKISLDRKLDVVFDAGGGTLGIILPEVIKKLNLGGSRLFFELDPALARREPNPLLISAQRKAGEEILRSGAEAGFIFDPDGDRLVVLDERGKMVRSDAILWLLASRSALPGDAIVADLRASHALREELEEKKMRVLRSRVGRSFIQEIMREEDAVLGAELSGHFFFKECFYADSALFAALKLLEIISKRRAPLSELVKPFERYFRSDEMSLKAAAPELVLAALARHYQDGHQNYLDGLTVEYPHFWFNVRPSNTENLLRMVLEARDEKTFEEKKDELAELLIKLGASPA